MIDSDRRRSLDLPILYKLFSVDVSISPPRAQSEPPSGVDSKENLDKIYLLPEQDCDEKSEISCSIVEVEQHLENLNGNSILVTLPPDVYEYKKTGAQPKIKNNLQKSKRHKKKRTSGAETAEEMFNRLTKSMNGENSTTTEEIDEEIENIEEIPLDSVQEANPVENNDYTTDDSTNVLSAQVENPITVIPATSSNEEDYLKIREARLARLEAETKEFYEKMTRNKEKRIELDNRLSNVHKNFIDRQKDKSENVNNQSANSSENCNSESNPNTQNPKTPKTPKPRFLLGLRIIYI